MGCLPFGSTNDEMAKSDLLNFVASMSIRTASTRECDKEASATSMRANAGDILLGLPVIVRAGVHVF